MLLPKLTHLSISRVGHRIVINLIGPEIISTIKLFLLVIDDNFDIFIPENVRDVLWLKTALPSESQCRVICLDNLYSSCL